jgi:hypothetical protein
MAVAMVDPQVSNAAIRVDRALLDLGLGEDRANYGRLLQFHRESGWTPAVGMVAGDMLQSDFNKLHARLVGRKPERRNDLLLTLGVATPATTNGATQQAQSALPASTQVTTTGGSGNGSTKKRTQKKVKITP